MAQVDIVSYEVATRLRTAAGLYADALNGTPPALPGVDSFAQLYLERDDEEFVTRFTPDGRSEVMPDGETKITLFSLAVGIEDLKKFWRANLQIQLGEGYEPPVIVAPVIHLDRDETAYRKTEMRGTLVRALYEREGRALTLDLVTATKRAVAKRRPFRLR
jgi:hypothetical protein